MKCPDDITFEQEAFGQLHMVTMYKDGKNIKSCEINPRFNQTQEQAVQHAKDVLLYWYDREPEEGEEI